MDLFGDALPGTHTGDPTAPEPERPPPPARAPRATGRLDLADWETPSPAPTSRRWVLLAAVAPWIVVAAILLSSPRAPGQGTPAAPAPTTTSLPATGQTPPPATRQAPGDSPPPTVPAEATGDVPITLGATTGPTTRGEAVGLAAVVARSWLSTRPAGVSIEGVEPGPDADRHYVEHLVVESIDHPARGALVVVVRALVLPVEDDTYGTGRHVRLAVPVVLDADRARPAGPPWPLAVDDDVRVQAPTTSPVDDPDLMAAAAEAVAAAGYRDLSLTSLDRTSGWAWIAHVEGRAPGQQETTAHEVWLRSDVGRLVVAGTAPPAPARPPSAPTAPPSPTPHTDPEVTR